MLENLYVCRHGFRSNWIDKTITSGPTRMQRDPPLAAYGLEQSESLAEFLSSPPDGLPTPELIFTSPFYRCIQTSAPLSRKMKMPLRLEPGVQEWYSNTLPDTGLHPRPAGRDFLQQFFDVELAPWGKEQNVQDGSVYVSRRGESLSELLARAELFVDVFTRRVEEEYPDVKTVVIYAHAASVIALGRALTGNKSFSVTAGCASTSFYTRKQHAKPASELPLATKTPTPKSFVPDGVVDENATGPVANGEWECHWTGRADYLKNGLERDWSFNDVVLNDEGHVIMDKGDGQPHVPEDELPLGLPKHLAKYLTKPDPYTSVVMQAAPEQVKQLAGHGKMDDKQDVDRAVITTVDPSSRPDAKRQGSGVALLESRM